MAKNKHSDLLREAIADANAIRDVQFELAKQKLKEAFAPRVQRMISTKLAEEEEDEIAVDDVEDVDDSELDLGTGDDEVVEEDEFGDEEELDITDDGDEEEFEVTEDDELEVEDELDAPVADDLGSDDEEEFEVTEDDELELDAPSDEDEEFEMDLESVIKELEDELEGEDDELAGIEDEEPIEEEADSSDIGQGDNKMPSAASSDDSTPDPAKEELYEDDEEGAEQGGDDMTIDELLKTINEMDGDEESVEQEEEPAEEYQEVKENLKKTSKQLREAYKVINVLRKRMQEMNLTNAKLLYTAKLFNKFNLSEAKRIQVIETFDRATTIRETKLVFTTLGKALTEASNKSKSPKRRTIKESVSRSGSRPTRSTRPNDTKILSEGTELRKRFERLGNVQKEIK